jgi:hypothetical protein
LQVSGGHGIVRAQALIRTVVGYALELVRFTAEAIHN